MSEHRRAVSRPAGTSVTRRQRLLVGAVGALGAGGLILGGAGVPVSAGEVNAVGNPYASVEAQDGCVTAAAGTGEADGSVAPQQGEPGTLEAAGQGTATVTVCPDDPGGSLPDDPGDIVPGEPGDIVPGDPGDPGEPGDVVPGELDDIVPGEPGDVVPGELDDIVPDDPGGSLEGEIVGVVTAALDGELPGGGDGSLPGDLPDGLDGIVPDDGDGSFPGDPGDGSFPGDPGDGSFPGDPGDLPGGLGGLVPDGTGIDASDLFDRLAEIITGAGDGGGPGGSDGNGGSGGAPAVNTSTNGSVSGSVAVGGVDAERGDPADIVLGSEIGGGAPALVGTSVSPGGTLPRTGGGLGSGVLRLVALLGLGRGLVGLAKRR